MPKRNSNERKKAFVCRAVQGRAIWQVVLYWMIYHVFLWHVLFIADGILGFDPMWFGDRYASFFSEHMMLPICAIAILPIILMDVTKLTHRVVGPFVRVEQALSEMAQGRQVRTIVPRKKDVVTGFVRRFNEFIEYHNQEIKQRTARSESDGCQSVVLEDQTVEARSASV